MKIKILLDKASTFLFKRLSELMGVILLSFSVLLLISLLSYSPEDPNFIFPDNTKIKNILGVQGSYISDLFFQSIGIIAYLLSFTYLVTGINIFRNKNLFIIIENTFFSIIYCIFGSIFFDFFYKNTFELHITFCPKTPISLSTI